MFHCRVDHRRQAPSEWLTAKTKRRQALCSQLSTPSVLQKTRKLSSLSPSSSSKSKPRQQLFSQPCSPAQKPTAPCRGRALRQPWLISDSLSRPRVVPSSPSTRRLRWKAGQSRCIGRMCPRLRATSCSSSHADFRECMGGVRSRLLLLDTVNFDCRCGSAPEECLFERVIALTTDERLRDTASACMLHRHGAQTRMSAKRYVIVKGGARRSAFVTLKVSRVCAEYNRCSSIPQLYRTQPYPSPL
jgi:hypothetical protein